MRHVKDILFVQSDASSLSKGFRYTTFMSVVYLKPVVSENESDVSEKVFLKHIIMIDY